MNEQNLPDPVVSETPPIQNPTAVTPEVPSQVYPLPQRKPNQLEKALASPKRRFAVFAGLFGLVGAAVLISSFASVPAQKNLIDGFKNLAKNRPTLVTGSANLQYVGSADTKKLGVTFKTTLVPHRTDSSTIGQLTVNDTAFPFAYTRIGHDNYFKLDNTSKVSSVVHPGNPVYPYLASRFNTISSVDHQWLLNRPSAAKPAAPAPSKYSCVQSTNVSLSARDAQRLQSIFVKTPPVKFSKVNNTKLNGEGVSESVLVMSSQSAVNTFATQISGLDVVKRIDSCSQQLASSKATPKVRDAFKNNNVKVSVFMNSSKTIKRITVSTSGKKSSLQLSADFTYKKQPAVVAPTGAVSADNFIRALMNDAVTPGDKAKEKDLYTINIAIEKYIRTYNKLPATLSELNIRGLNNPVNTYEYNYKSRTTDGGPTLAYTTCAIFQTTFSDGKEDYTSNITPESFVSHKSGRSCFVNGYYKGQSHLGVQK